MRGERYSDQARLLRRRLSLKLLRDWLVYTVLFASVALVLNVTLVPRIADDVADATSEWRYWDLADYSLETCLDGLDGHLLAVQEPSGDPVEDEERRQSILYEVELAFEVMTATGTPLEDILAEGSISHDASGELAPSTHLLVTLDGSRPEWFTLDELRQQLIYKDALSNGSSLEDWQFYSTESTIEGRDLSVYKGIRALKLPIALGSYLLGCILVVLMGFGRSLRYFDELSRAVGGLLSDKEKPVELSRDLLITQSELNDIRLSSLADERAAKAAEQRKDELVAYLAHDIKTPLTSVLGYLLLLDEAPDMAPGTRRRYIKTAVDKAERLEGLIDEFFEITRYNLQSIPIEREQVDLTMLCQQVADESFPEAEARSLTLAVTGPKEAKAFVDPDKLARAVGNVVRNAVAFADSGTAVEISLEPDADRWRLTIADQGKEISPAHLESIFEKFYREDASRSSASGRAGLGLAIAKEIVLAHKGTITAISEEGLTAFTITLPR